MHSAIIDTLVPFAKRQYPHLAARLTQNPLPPSGNLIVVRYSADIAGRTGLELHKDGTAVPSIA